MTRSQRSAAYLDEMKEVTPSRQKVEEAIARARARQGGKKANPPSRVTIKKQGLSLESSPPIRSLNWQPEPPPSKKRDCPTKTFFHNVSTSRSAPPSTDGRDFGHNSFDHRVDFGSRTMMDPPTGQDPPSMDAPGAAADEAAASEDERREDGDSVSACSSLSRKKKEGLKTFQLEKFELESVAESKECDFGLETSPRHLPNSPSMKSDVDENYDSWDLQGVASEETMKATGNSRRTRPHKGTFVRKGKKKKSDNGDGKIIQSLFSVDSSVAPVDSLFDQDCFSDDGEYDSIDLSEEKPRKADPPVGSDPDSTKVTDDSHDVMAQEPLEVPEEDGKIDEVIEIEEDVLPCDKKGTSLAHVEQLVASINAKKNHEKDKPESNEEIKDSVSNQNTEKVCTTKKDAEIDSINQEEGSKKYVPAEEREEYEDFVSDFLRSGSSDGSPESSNAATRDTLKGELIDNEESIDSIADSLENDCSIGDEAEQCESQNAFLEQFENLVVEEESEGKKVIGTNIKDGVAAVTSLDTDIESSGNVKSTDSDVLDCKVTTDESLAYGTSHGETKAKEEGSETPEHYIAEKNEDESPELNNNDAIDKKQLPNEEMKNEFPAESRSEEIEGASDEIEPDENDNETLDDPGTKNESPTESETHIDELETRKESTDSLDGETMIRDGIEKSQISAAAKNSDLASSVSHDDVGAQENQENEESNHCIPIEEKPDEPIYVFKFAKSSTEYTWQDEYTWQERNEMALDVENDYEMSLDVTTATKNLHRFTNILDKEPEPRPWKISYKQRTRNHAGFENVDIYSVLESTEVTIAKERKDDYIPWEHRDTKQRFLQERSVEFARNWFGENQSQLLNSKFKLPVCQPRSMEMPIRTADEALEWSEEIYTAWKSPYQMVEHERLKLSKSGDESSEEEQSQSVTQSDSTKQKCSVDDGDGQHSQGDHFNDDCSHSGRSHFDGGSYTGSEGSYTDDEGSYFGSEVSDEGSVIIIDDNETVATWEDAPECGEIVNTRLKIGEHVTRVHPEYTSSLRRSRWRKKYFPKGSFPY